MLSVVPSYVFKELQPGRQSQIRKFLGWISPQEITWWLRAICFWPQDQTRHYCALSSHLELGFPWKASVCYITCFSTPPDLCIQECSLIGHWKENMVIHNLQVWLLSLGSLRKLSCGRENEWFSDNAYSSECPGWPSVSLSAGFGVRITTWGCM